MGQGELTSDPRFSSERSRVANRLAIDEIVERWTKSIDEAALTQTLRAAEIPSSPIYSIADIFADPQYAARGTLAMFRHPKLGEVVMPVRGSQAFGDARRDRMARPRARRRHRRSAFASAGGSRARVDDLRRRGVV
jgi:crotonobetainyl-CoA:carnitine CoA-transferase CaiB-like acyl-CoA transferase